jgi:hypothetical protein
MAGEPKRRNLFAILARNARISGLLGAPSGAKLLMNRNSGPGKAVLGFFPDFRAILIGSQLSRL